MNYSVNWGLLQPADVPGSMMRGVQFGMELRRAADERRYQAEDRQRAAEARDAHAAYLLAGGPEQESAFRAFSRGAEGPNALLPGPALAAPSVRPNALSAFQGAGNPVATRSAFGGPPAARPNALLDDMVPSDARPSPPAASTEPQPSARDLAFARWAKLDPAGATEMRRGEVLEQFQRLRNYNTLNDLGMQLLAGVTDQESWDRARARARELWARFGEEPSAIDQLPARWTPELSNQLRLQGMDTQRQLAALLSERRLAWDITDDELDNARADEALESLNEYRESQLEHGEERLRQGRDRIRIEEADPRRVAPRTPQPSPGSVIGRIMDKISRGERLTPNEQRLYDDHRRGRGRRPGRRGGGDGAVAIGPDGRRYVPRGGRWVPAE